MEKRRFLGYKTFVVRLCFGCSLKKASPKPETDRPEYSPNNFFELQLYIAFERHLNTSVIMALQPVKTIAKAQVC